MVGVVSGGANPQIGLSHVSSLLTSIFDANMDGVVTTTEGRLWFFAKTLRLLWCLVILDLCQWFFTLKAAPTMEELKTRSKNYDREDFVSQALRRYCGGLRGDPGVSWDVQARSALIDKAMTVGAYILTAYYCLSALGVNMSGLLAVGGVSGIAIGFAAQKLVSNCIGGILIFVTQPFVEGDRVQFATGWGQIDGRVDMVGWHSTRIAASRTDTRTSSPTPTCWARAEEPQPKAVRPDQNHDSVPGERRWPSRDADVRGRRGAARERNRRRLQRSQTRCAPCSTTWPKVRINAFIDASKDEQLHGQRPRDADHAKRRQKLQPAEDEAFDVGLVNNVISAARLNAGVAELQKIIANATKTVSPKEAEDSK